VSNEANEAAEPPAPPAQHSFHVCGDGIQAFAQEDCLTCFGIAGKSACEALRAEVARLQEELKQAQITLLLGRGRADELSSLMKLIVSWTEADAYGHRNDSGAGNWQSRAEKARRAAELLESTLHLRDVAEAEAQALRERNSTLEREIADLTDMTRSTVIVKRPAQEAP
jgi:cell division protein FtsB